MADYIMTNHQVCGKLLHVAENLKTLYVMGGIGYPLNRRGKERSKTHAYNNSITRRYMIENADAETFAFDCVCLIKSVVYWGFNGNKDAVYGGAKYASNGMPDCNIDTLFKMGSKHSTDMKDIAEGEFLRLHAHHCGVYVGNGMVVEATPAWDNKVQVTKMSARPWKQHCYLPFIKYEVPEQETFYPFPDKTDVELAYLVIHGALGNGQVRKDALGIRYREVQDIVNRIAKGGRP